jgi:alpha-tubulin suppressor-like RCC1 family protein
MQPDPPAIAAGRRHSIARRWDGTVLAAGNDAAGECQVGVWDEIVSVAAGNVHAASNTGRSHTVGLRSDGTVVATGWDGDGQCNVHASRGVTAVAAGWRSTLGLLADGTVVATGRRSEGQGDKSSWREVVGISCGDWHSVAVRTNGTAVAVGVNRRGQCAVEQWRDIAAVAAGYLHTLARTSDGRVLATGDQRTGACEVGTWVLGRHRRQCREQRRRPVRDERLDGHPDGAPARVEQHTNHCGTAEVTVSLWAINTTNVPLTHPRMGKATGVDPGENQPRQKRGGTHRILG